VEIQGLLCYKVKRGNTRIVMLQSKTWKYKDCYVHFQQYTHKNTFNTNTVKNKKYIHSKEDGHFECNQGVSQKKKVLSVKHKLGKFF
jgi:hypothetical protein